MTTLARSSVGRHFPAILDDRWNRLDIAGVFKQFRWIATATAPLARARNRMIGAVALYLAKPVKHSSPAATDDPQSLAAILDRGDVLLTYGNTRFAALVKRFTRSTWSHVSMYVGPLEEGPDPLCIVEADIVAGVRPIRLSELNALQVRVLRPKGLNEMHRRQLADWVVGRIGSGYDLGHALALGRKFLRLPARLRSAPGKMGNSATRFICSSLLAHAFALVGYPILRDQMQPSPIVANDHRNITPGDFEHAPVFEMVGQINAFLGRQDAAAGYV
jgi:hypothetical protein